MEHILAVVANWIMHVVSTLGYPGIVLLMALESACVPLPSEIIMPFAGALCSVGVALSQVPPTSPLNIYLVALAGAIGCAVGSALAYAVGVYGGRTFVERRLRFLITARDLDRGDIWFTRWGHTAVFGSRLLPIVRTFISLPAGIARMRFLPFIVLSFVGSLPWCLALAWVGFSLGNHWDALRPWFRKADLVIAAVILGLAVFWLRHRVTGRHTAD